MASRMLVQDLVSSPDAVLGGVSKDNTLGLRIAAVFIIFIASLLGSLPPLFLKSFQRGSSSHIALLIRAFAAGVILALGLVHILPDGYEDMNGLGLGTLVGWTSMNSEYPIGGVTALVGMFVIIVMESVSHAVSRGRVCGHHPGGGGGGGDSASVRSSHEHHQHSHADAAGGARHLHSDSNSDSASMAVDVGTACGSHHHLEKSVHGAVALGTPAAGGAGGGSGNGDGADHAHGCVSLRAASVSAWFGLPTTDLGNDEELRRFKVVALIMEVGCVFHSVIIGITLGVNVDSISTARALTIALVFHQGLEGLSLGSVIARAGFAATKSIGMACLYSVTTPAGIAIGIAIASTYNPESVTAFAVQGTLNCFSGGLLIYIGLVQLIAEDFSREDMLAAGNWGLRLSAYALLMLGGAIMCTIAIWA